MLSKIYLALLGSTLALAQGGIGCTVPNPDYQPGTDGSSGLSWDGSAQIMPFTDALGLPPALDQAVGDPSLDQAVPPPKLDKGATIPSFGKICTSSKGCASGELCVFTEPEATKGICLRKCQVMDKLCDVPDPKFYSACAIYYNASGQVKVCVIFCKLPNKTFPCPNNTDYRCKVFDNGLGMCVPKSS